MAKAKYVSDEDEVLQEAAEMQATMEKPIASPGDQQAAINQGILAALEKIANRQEAGPIPQLSVAQAVFKTPWNPTGKKDRIKLTRPVRINNHPVRDMMLSEDEITRLNALKPGRYHDRKWIVWEKDDDQGNATLHVNFPNKTPDQKIEIMQAHKGAGLAGLLDIILAEQNAVRA